MALVTDIPIFLPDLTRLSKTLAVKTLFKKNLDIAEAFYARLKELDKFSAHDILARRQEGTHLPPDSVEMRGCLKSSTV